MTRQGKDVAQKWIAFCRRREQEEDRIDALSFEDIQAKQDSGSDLMESIFRGRVESRSFSTEKRKEGVIYELLNIYDKALYILASFPSPVYYLHLSFLAFTAIFFANIQVATRLLCAASPVLHWHIAHVLRPRLHMYSDKAPEHTNRFAIAILFWCGSYSVLGPVLHSNAFPWT